jgi:hypothetical protein
MHIISFIERLNVRERSAEVAIPDGQRIAEFMNGIHFFARYFSLSTFWMLAVTALFSELCGAS